MALAVVSAVRECFSVAEMGDQAGEAVDGYYS
jgi:hypothetical protein